MHNHSNRLYISIYIYIYIFVRIGICICIHIYDRYMHIYTVIYRCICIYAYKCMDIYITYMYICIIYTCTYVCIIYTYVYIYICPYHPHVCTHISYHQIPNHKHSYRKFLDRSTPTTVPQSLLYSRSVTKIEIIHCGSQSCPHTSETFDLKQQDAPNYFLTSILA